MNVSLIQVTNGAEALAGTAAAVCTRTQNTEKALNAAIASGHESVLEHIVFTFLISGISRITLAQLTRHRLASYSVESQRYVNQGDQEYVIPHTVQDNDKARRVYCMAMLDAWEAYCKLVGMGIPEEDARYVLPQGICTRLAVTMNARELLHFFSQRCCNRAQWEINELANQMLGICRRECPNIFRHAGPGCVRGHCPEKRPCGHPVGGSDESNPS